MPPLDIGNRTRPWSIARYCLPSMGAMSHRAEAELRSRSYL